MSKLILDDLFTISLITSAQRCRDAGVSGFAALALCLPYLGTVAWVVMLVWPGVQGKNRFGDDPKEMIG